MLAALLSRLVSTPVRRRKKPTERRAWVRRAGGRATFCEVMALPENLPIRVTLLNISEGGIGLICPGPLAPGTFLAIRLEGAKGYRRLVRAYVIHATPRDDDESSWLLGCVLTDRLRPSEVEALL